MRLLVLPAILVLLAGCSDRQPEAQIVNIYAASSLADVFHELERDFEAEHLGVNVVLTFLHCRRSAAEGLSRRVCSHRGPWDQPAGHACGDLLHLGGAQ